MNNFASIDSSKGILKEYYNEGDAIDAALKKKRETMSVNRGIISPEDYIKEKVDGKA